MSKRKPKCDCHNHERQVCDICQKVTGKEKDRRAWIPDDDSPDARRSGFLRSTTSQGLRKVRQQALLHMPDTGGGSVIQEQRLREALTNILRLYELPVDQWNQPSPGHFYREAKAALASTPALTEGQIKVIIHDALKNQFVEYNSPMPLMIAESCAGKIYRALSAAAPASDTPKEKP